MTLVNRNALRSFSSMPPRNCQRTSGCISVSLLIGAVDADQQAGLFERAHVVVQVGIGAAGREGGFALRFGDGIHVGKSWGGQLLRQSRLRAFQGQLDAASHAGEGHGIVTTESSGSHRHSGQAACENRDRGRGRSQSVPLRVPMIERDQFPQKKILDPFEPVVRGR